VFEPQDKEQDAGADGAFDAKAHTHDPLLWMSMHRRALLSGLVGVGAAATAGVSAMAGRRSH
jgi:hypothetical protein